LLLSPEEEGMAEDVLGRVLATLVEAIHVELAYEGVDIAVAEVLGQNVILEVINFLDGELTTITHPMDNSLIVLVFQNLETLLDEVSDRCVS
jgi:hypothetical protein